MPDRAAAPRRRFYPRRLDVDIDEPPLCHIVLIGKNSRGQWVVRERNGLFGGLFVSQQAAIRYALFENDHHPEAIMATAGLLEIDIGAVPLPELRDSLHLPHAA
jgi:hypothetical protein